MNRPADTSDRARDRGFLLVRPSASGEDRLLAAGSSQSGAGATDLLRLADHAALHLQGRQRRAEYFPGSLFAEPAWDLLLTLFTASVREVPLTTTQACDATGSSMATALRYLHALEKYGFVEIAPSVSDSRVRRPSLSPLGIERMAAALAAFFPPAVTLPADRETQS